MPGLKAGRSIEHPDILSAEPHELVRRHVAPLPDSSLDILLAPLDEGADALPAVAAHDLAARFILDREPQKINDRTRDVRWTGNDVLVFDPQNVAAGKGSVVVIRRDCLIDKAQRVFET